MAETETVIRDCNEGEVSTVGLEQGNISQWNVILEDL